MAEAPKLDDSPLGQRSEPSHRLVEGDPALLGTSEGSPEHQHPVAKVAELLGFDAKLLPSRTTFSSDIAYSDSPAASRASSTVTYIREAVIKPSSTV